MPVVSDMQGYIRTRQFYMGKERGGPVPDEEAAADWFRHYAKGEHIPDSFRSSVIGYCSMCKDVYDALSGEIIAHLGARGDSIDWDGETDLPFTLTPCSECSDAAFRDSMERVERMRRYPTTAQS